MVEWVLYFFVYAILGWALEVSYVLLETGKLVNRGFLHGPLCPVYGVGAVLLILFTTPFSHRWWLLFLAGGIIASALEYAAGWLLQTAFGAKWWDYSEEPFNLHGWICLRFSVYWALAAVVLVKGVHPLVLQLTALLPASLLPWISGALILIFLVDFGFTLYHLIDLRKTFGALHRQIEELKTRGEALREKYEISELSRTLEDLKAKGEALREKYEASELGKVLEELKLKGEALREKYEISELGKSLQEKYRLRMEKTALRNRRLFRAFPNVKSKRYPEELSDMKTHLREKRRGRRD